MGPQTSRPGLLRSLPALYQADTSVRHYALECLLWVDKLRAPEGPSASGLQQQLAAAGSSLVLGSVASWSPQEHAYWQGKRWATKKQGGSTKTKPNSNPKHLGTKMTQGQVAFPGQIIIRQRGSRFWPGWNVGQGKDFTLFSKSVGYVNFRTETTKRPDRPLRKRRVIDVLPLNDDYSPGYQQKVKQMVDARNQIRQRLLGLKGKYS